MEHRVPALRLAFIVILVFSVPAAITTRGGTSPVEAIVMSILGLFLLSPAADWVERKER